MKTVIFWILVGIVAAASAERIDKNECANTRDLPSKILFPKKLRNTPILFLDQINGPCLKLLVLGSSSEVHVDPCPEALNGESCILYKGSNATVTIKFTPGKLKFNLRHHLIKAIICSQRTY